VLHFDGRRGFGKLWSIERRSVFVHRDDLVDVLALEPGQRVEFDVVESDRGPRAANVKLCPFTYGGD
jgi:cold shock CspA family protein